jgi:two-component system, sensor histidine kinase
VSQRVLVVEDNDDGRDMLISLLRADGHEVFEASTGQEGIEMALRHSPAVVLLDIGLPDVNGYEVGRQLRERLGGSFPLAHVVAPRRSGLS